MSGVAGGNRIEKADVQKTFQKYIKEVLKKVPGFKKAELSGSVKVGSKSDYGDLDLITLFEGEDKKEVKQRIISVINSLPSTIIIPFKSEKYLGRKYYNSGEIISVLYPIEGKENQYIQVDNIISLTDEEHKFKGGFLDIPAEKQGLILGLTKVVLLEENPQDVFKRMGIKNIPTLEENEEFEFNLSSNKLTLRKVKLEGFKEVSREEIWTSTNWNSIKDLLSNYNIEGSFEELLVDVVHKLKNPRSKNRVKGIFKSMISVKSGEANTPKGDNKEKALSKVDSLLEQENKNKTVALYGGGFKPPHLAHFNNAKILAGKADKVVIFIGKKVREGLEITPDQSLQIWKVYSKYIPTDIELKISPISPVTDIYEYVEYNENTVGKIITGALPDEMNRFTGFLKQPERHPNLEILTLPEVKDEDNKFSATAIRHSETYLKTGNWIPKEVSKSDREKILNILAPTLMEMALTGTLEDLFSTKEEIKEGSLGTPIALVAMLRSDDRARLIQLYDNIRKTYGEQDFNIEFHQDHIRITPKGEGERKGFDYTPYMSSILEYMIDQKMKIMPLPEIKIRKDLTESENFFGKTAYYDPSLKEVVLYVEGRHPKDIMRSFVHEMIHHIQNLEGRLGLIGTSDTNEDNNLLEIEKEAYLQGNITFRNWEDGQKNKTVVSEGKYDKISNDISSAVFKVFKTAHLKGEDVEETFRVGPEEDADYNHPLEFDLNLHMGNTEDTYSADGGANPGIDDDGDEIQPLINIVFQVPKKIDYQELSMDIKDVIRHEIEHLTQDGTNLKQGKYLGNDQTLRDLINVGLLDKNKYYTLPKEIDAMIQGMYFKAKKSKTPFKDVVDDYLNKVKVTPEEGLKIKRLWSSRIKALGLKVNL